MIFPFVCEMYGSMYWALRELFTVNTEIIFNVTEHKKKKNPKRKKKKHKQTFIENCEK